ncbi:GNAT family N-acetyltransferase [Brevibacillus formosus]|uniref:GNAT family N-acetyltransferase n=1 Tax=Brevibacillus formosus TaxID=54913 RepID=UPI001C66AF64|nr:GNAT family N-acetyltransferase [Brevibacillus formosus]MBW5470838.1 GNAT family N-acetyltransferase [Brevibacillus formosus]
MYLVKGNQQLARQLLHDKSDVMFAGVVAGNHPGLLWVDNPDKPSCALVWSTGLSSFAFLGVPSKSISPAAFTAFFQTQIGPFLLQKDLSYFEFSRESKEWDSFLTPIMGGSGWETSTQLVYQTSRDQGEKPSLVIPAPYYSVELEESFLRGRGTVIPPNLDFVTDYLHEYWYSIDDFLENGYGYAALTTDHEVASICMSTAVYQSTHAIGVETIEPYRQKGLSSTLAYQLQNRLHQEAATVWWDCMDSNVASQKTAEKAGLHLSHRYEIAWFSYPAQ